MTLNRTYVYLFFLCFALVACKNDKKRKETLSFLKKIEGNWICHDYLAQIEKNKSVFNLRPPRFNELVIKASFNDTIYALNAFEISQQKVELKDSILNLTSVDRSTAQITIIQDSANVTAIQFRDSTGTWLFNKANPTQTRSLNGFSEGFMFAVNKILFEGNYQLLDNANKPLRKVHFSSNGTVDGLVEFDRYSVCLGGDCTKIPEGKLDIIYLTSEARGYFHGWQFKADTLYIYSLGSANTAENNSYKPFGVKYKLLKSNT